MNKKCQLEVIFFAMPDSVLTIWFGLLRLILSFLHLVYSGLQYFDLAWVLFKRKFSGGSDMQLCGYVAEYVKNLDKCPTHLAVILGTEKINHEDFSNLVVWCMAAGISFITFYDYTGYLKENEDSYYKYFIDKKKVDLSYVKLKNRINGVKKNGIAQITHVNILSLEDGKQKFAELVVNLSKRAVDEEISWKDINEGLIDQEMREMLKIQDPELALVCGRVLGTFGFLPWHIRLTEFLHVPTIENIKAPDFTSILSRYSRCQQRFGK